MKDQQSPEYVNRPKSHNILFKIPGYNPKLSNIKNDENVTTSLGKGKLTDTNTKITQNAETIRKTFLVICLFKDFVF